jgi:DNA-3-methyladenine glycosylase I
MTYCEYLGTISGEQLALHRDYHDNHYGFPVYDDNRLFERLMFEINQAGLNWLLILKKQDSFRTAFHNFDIDTVAAYDEQDFERLMNDKGIIRNRLKINAAVKNAAIIAGLRKDYGSFRKWLDMQAVTNVTLQEWTKLFRKTFVFTGGEIVNEFLVSIGMLPGAHHSGCPVFERILKIQSENEKK